MKKSKIYLLKILLFVFDSLASLIFIFVFPLFFLFFKLGAKRLFISRMVFKKLGYYPIFDHYYQPSFKIINSENIKREKLQNKLYPFNIKSQVNFLKKLNYVDELESVFTEKLNSRLININNRSFSSGDAEFLFQFLRYIKPRKVIEIGCGNSTLIISEALKRNNKLNNSKSQLLCIEPFENEWLESIVKKVIREKVEDLPLKTFQSLEENDLLFIDSSHILKPNQDVFHIYNYILPQLKKGVYIHIHDIFSPKDYLNEWLVEDVRFWNEQYLLECILSSSNRYETIVALNYLKNNKFKELKKVCPFIKSYREPGSFYLRVK